MMSVGLRSMFSLKGNQTKFNKTAFKNTSLFDIVVASVKEVCRGIGKPVSIDKIHTKIGAILKGSPNDRGGEHYKSKPHKSTVTLSTSSGMSTSAQTAPDSDSAGTVDNGDKPSHPGDDGGDGGRKKHRKKSKKHKKHKKD